MGVETQHDVMSTWPSDGERDVSPLTSVAIVLVVTAILIAVVGLFVFDLTADEGAPPEVQWELTVDEHPVLHHGGGDPVRCELITVEGALGTGNDLCAYFDETVIEAGQSARLTDVPSTSGSITLEWYDVETDRSIPIAELEMPDD